MSDWNLAPTGTVKLIQENHTRYWVNEEGHWWDDGDNTWNIDSNGSNNVLIATKPNWVDENRNDFIDNAMENCAPEGMTEEQADAVEQVLFNMFDAGYIKELKS